MILGQLRIGARSTTYAALSLNTLTYFLLICRKIWTLCNLVWFFYNVSGGNFWCPCNQYFTDIEQTLEPILSRVLLTGERETLWKGGERRKGKVSRETLILKDWIYCLWYISCICWWLHGSKCKGLWIGAILRLFSAMCQLSIFQQGMFCQLLFFLSQHIATS